MREDEVKAAEMDLEDGAQELLRHRRALDVPAGTPATPGRVPPRVFTLFRSLPQREVARVLLERARILVGLDLVQSLAREPAVVSERRHAEVHVPARLVGVPAADQLFDQRDDL